MNFEYFIYEAEQVSKRERERERERGMTMIWALSA